MHIRNLQHLAANLLLKLPSNKFTVREREMLIGSRILPVEFFEKATNPFVIGIGACEHILGASESVVGPEGAAGSEVQTD